MPRPLLPPVPADWAAHGRAQGINLEAATILNGLAAANNIEPAGVPSPLAHPFAFKTKLSRGVDTALEDFYTLVKALFLGVIKPRLLDAGQFGSVVKRFDPRVTSFYICEWTRQIDVAGLPDDDIDRTIRTLARLGARQVERGEGVLKVAFPVAGLHPDCLVFPGATFAADQFREWNANWPGLRDDVNRQEAVVGRDIARSLFRQWVKEIAAHVGAHPPIWLGLMNALEGEWPTVVQAPNGALDDWTEVVEVPFAFGDPGARVNVPIRSISRRIFCDKLVRLHHEGVTKYPDLPVKSEFLSLVQECNADAAPRYGLTLHGWKGEIGWEAEEDNVIDGGPASILLWPDFEAQGWHVNYVLFHPSEQLNGEDPSVRALLSDGTSVVLKEDAGYLAGARTPENVTHVEMLCRGKPVGVFRVDRPHLNPPAGNVLVSLDFGTVHTALGIKDAHGGGPTAFRLRDCTLDILGMNYLAPEDAAGLALWLPTYCEGRTITTLPSEIYFRTAEARNGGVASLNYPIERFTVPHTHLALQAAQAAQQVVSRFKWEEPPVFAGHRAELVSCYLKLVMHMALATLRKEYNAATVDVVATYPLAFDAVRNNLYRDWLTNMMNELFDETGVMLQFATTHTEHARRDLVAESLAGKALWEPGRGIASLVVDIGGGTTDIALTLHDRVLACDSIRYAGDIFVRWLAEQALGAGLPEDPAARAEMLLDKMTELNMQLRRSDPLAFLDAHFHDEREAVKAACLRFFQGLFEYLLFLLVGYECHNRVVHFHPIGNGWKMVSWLEPPNNDLQAFVRNWFAGRGVNTNVVIDPEIGFKDAVALGAVKIACAANYISPDLDAPVKSGVSGVRLEWGRRRRDIGAFVRIPYEVRECHLHHNPHFETHQFVSGVGLEPLSDIGIDQIAAELNQICASHDPDEGIAVDGAHGLLLRRSPFARFLEYIYPKYYL